MQARLDEEAGQLVQLRQNIGQEWAGRAPAGEARHLAQDVQHRIADDARARPPPASSGVGQNLAAAAILLRAMPEPSTTEGRRIQGELKNLLEDVAVYILEQLENTFTHIHCLYPNTHFSMHINFIVKTYMHINFFASRRTLIIVASALVTSRSVTACSIPFCSLLSIHGSPDFIYLCPNSFGSLFFVLKYVIT